MIVNFLILISKNIICYIIKASLTPLSPLCSGWQEDFYTHFWCHYKIHLDTHMRAYEHFCKIYFKWVLLCACCRRECIVISHNLSYKEGKNVYH